MEEPAKTELLVSEEQLQEITGGCALCEVDQTLIGYHRAQWNVNRVNAETAAATGNHSAISYFANQANLHTQEANRLADQVMNRNLMGHTEPPNKRQRLQ